MDVARGIGGLRREAVNKLVAITLILIRLQALSGRRIRMVEPMGKANAPHTLFVLHRLIALVGPYGGRARPAAIAGEEQRLMWKCKKSGYEAIRDVKKP